MPFLQVSCELDATACQAAEDIFMEQGAMSVTLQDPGGDPVLEPPVGESPLWERARMLALFEADREPVAVYRALVAELGEASVRDWREERLRDQPWERAWMDGFVPMQFGKRLWVCPSNGRVEAGDAIVLKLDPGLAFGTGTHPTTALCLQWLDGMDLRGQRLLDYGCGSGILAVAGLLLGAGGATGVDNDPQALVASGRNAARNGVAGRLSLFPPPELPPLQADVLVANILSAVLVDLAADLARLVRPGGAVALSGILDHQARVVHAAYAADFLLENAGSRDGWVLLAGHRRRD